LLEIQRGFDAHDPTDDRPLVVYAWPRSNSAPPRSVTSRLRWVELEYAENLTIDAFVAKLSAIDVLLLRPIDSLAIPNLAATYGEALKEFVASGGLVVSLGLGSELLRALELVPFAPAGSDDDYPSLEIVTPDHPVVRTLGDSIDLEGHTQLWKDGPGSGIERIARSSEDNSLGVIAKRHERGVITLLGFRFTDTSFDMETVLAN